MDGDGFEQREVLRRMLSRLFWSPLTPKNDVSSTARGSTFHWVLDMQYSVDLSEILWKLTKAAEA